MCIEKNLENFQQDIFGWKAQFGEMRTLYRDLFRLVKEIPC